MLNTTELSNPEGLGAQENRETTTPQSALAFPYNPDEDGITHINVYSKGRTPLGRTLSNFAHTPFDHPEYGHFSSVEGFWYWLSTGGTRNELRGLYGFKSKEVGLMISDSIKKQGGFPIVEDFEAKIKKAILCKVEQNQELRELLKLSTLPLTHYYVFGNNGKYKVSYPANYAWIHEYISDLRDWLNGRAVKLIIAGSRSIVSYDVIESAYASSGYKAIEVISGRARGIDRLGEQFAKKHKLPLAKFPADWDTYPEVAGLIRNKQMAVYGDAGLLIWDGVSKGTQHMETVLMEANKPCYKYCEEESST